MILADEAEGLHFKGLKDHLFFVGDEDDQTVLISGTDPAADLDSIDSRHFDIKKK